MPLRPSELILNGNGSIYHLNLLPHQIADTIITVGDPDRVAKVSRHFDIIEHKVAKREFVTHTGIYRGKRISVISTGIGTDNIDIVLNELDALVNIDLEAGKIKEKSKSLTIIRIGTSGALQESIPVDSFLVSSHAIGMDGLLYYYDDGSSFQNDIITTFIEHCGINANLARPYMIEGDKDLLQQFQLSNFSGITLTNIGFYGPQGRSLRLRANDETLIDRIGNFEYKGLRVTNFEMETSAIYALSALMGHKAISLSAILANRITGEFSTKPNQTIDRLIEFTLNQLVKT